MTKISRQTINGKSFEYSLILNFHNRLKELTNVVLDETSALQVARRCYEESSEDNKTMYDAAAAKAVEEIIRLEPLLSNSISAKDNLELSILPDAAGQLGDVRDVIAIRAEQKWEIGISAKNNHKAVKHPRLSARLDFGKKWLGTSCSADYFAEIKSIFDRLKSIKSTSNRTALWSSITDSHETIYAPLLAAFKSELLRIYKAYPDTTAANLVKFLIGKNDFYKVIKQKGHVEIQAFNFNGTLGQSINKSNIKKTGIKLPTKIHNIDFEENSQSTLVVIFNEGWQISFRIHSASSKVDPSLKFDINLSSYPSTMWHRNFEI